VVALGHVGDLVRQDAGQLGFVDAVDQPLGDEDEAAGRREGVEAGIVEHAEGPRQLPAAPIAARSSGPAG
jgi:hypothetical protein